MSLPLSGKVAIVTGGTKGIGAATARKLVSIGANVVVNYGTDSSAAESLIKELGSDKALAIQADASSIAGVEMIVNQTIAAHGKIDILIPNAGTLPMADLESTTEEMFDRTYALNVKGPYFLCQKAVPHMAPGSRIILISTSVLLNSSPPPPYLLYGSSKGAIEQFARILAKDLGRKKILVNTVSPGPTSTELFLKGKPQPMIDTIASWSPFGKLGDPEEIADAITFLSGPSSRWISGTNLPVNGAAFV